MVGAYPDHRRGFLGSRFIKRFKERAAVRFELIIKILFVSPVACIGGAERIMLDCIQQIQALRPTWSVQVVLLAEGPLLERLKSMEADVDVLLLPSEVAALGTLPSSKNQDRDVNGRVVSSTGTSNYLCKAFGLPRFALFLWKLQKHIRRLKPDIVHSNSIKSHLCLSLLWLAPAKVIWHVQDYYSQRSSIKRLISALSYRSSGCLAISQSVADDILRVAPRMTIKLLENSADVSRFTPGIGEPARLDKIAGLFSAEDEDIVRIGLVATYANWKGHDVFLRAIQRCPNVRGYIIGGPIYTTTGSQWSEEQLRAKATELGIAERIGFIPFQHDLPWIYRSLDIVVHASTRPEPFGLTIAEAMACGRAVIVSDAGGAHELFTNMHDAIGHEPGNVESLTQAIQLLADDHVLRETLGKNARQTAIEKFSPTKFGEKLIAAYESDSW